MTNIYTITLIYKCDACGKYTAVYGHHYTSFPINSCDVCGSEDGLNHCSTVDPANMLERILNGDESAMAELKEFKGVKK